MNKLPLFVSDFSLKSILRWKEKAKSKANGPSSIVDLALENDLSEVFTVESTMSGFIDAFKYTKDAGLKLRFGYRVTVVNDAENKTDESLKEECKIIIFIKGGSHGYYDLIRIHNFCTVNGFYKIPRIDYKTLKKLWTKNLQLCIPFYDNHLHMNMLHGHQNIPSFDGLGEPVVFLEDSGLPFDDLIRTALINSLPDYEKIETRTCYYAKRLDLEAYQTYRCILNRSTLSRPSLNHFGSREFCLEAAFNN